MPSGSVTPSAFSGGTITPPAGGAGLDITPVSPNATGSETDALRLTVPQSAAPNFPNIYALIVKDPVTLQECFSLGSDGSVQISGAPFSTPLDVVASAVNPGTRVLRVTDANGQNPLEIRSNGRIGFFNTTPAAQPTVTGAKLPTDVVMASLLTALAALGLVVDSTT